VDAQLGALVVGVDPEVESRIARSIGPSCVASYGLTMTMRGSGTPTEAICVTGVGAP
jgi:hypothetical protein